jgi:hypothetical protein
MKALDLVKSVLPWIGTALGGPLGGLAAEAVGKALGMKDATIENVKNTLSGMPPEELVKLKLAELEVQLKMQELGLKSVFDLAELETKIIGEVNQTMRVEAAAEHWPTYSWRPFNGFLFGITIFCSYFLLPLFGIETPEIPNEVWLTWGGILGIASFFRGKAQADPEIPPAIQIPAKHKIVEKVIGKID